MIEQAFELFAVYGVSIEYPYGWSVEARALKRDQGLVSFKPNIGEISFTLTWFPLKEVQKKFHDPERQAEDTLKSFKSKSGIKEFELLEKKGMLINGHESILLRVRAKLKRGFLSRAWLVNNIQVLYVHCEETERCFILYSLSPPQESYIEMFDRMASSIKCH